MKIQLPHLAQLTFFAESGTGILWYGETYNLFVISYVSNNEYLNGSAE